MRFPLGARIFAGIAVGVLTGLLSPAAAQACAPVGEVFLRLLKMLMVPLVFFSVTDGICKMGDVRNLRSVGLGFIAYVLATSGLCAFIGAGAALALDIGGGGAEFAASGDVADPGAYSFSKAVVEAFPENVVASMADGALLQVIVFSVFLGAALLSLGDAVSGIARFMEEGTKVMIRITSCVMEFSPFGIAALMAGMMVSVEPSAMMKFVSFVVSANVLCLLLLVLFYPFVVRFLARVPGFRFLFKIGEPVLVAFTTTSSAATLPVSIETARKKLGVPEDIYSFTLPLGNTCGMNGFALVLGLFSVLAFNLCGREITFVSVLQFVFLGIVLSVGAAGVKGAGIVMTAMLLETMGLDGSLVPVVAALWPLIDPAMTVVNNASDLAGTVVVASKMGKLDKEEYK